MSDQKTKLYQALWRKAVTHPKPIEIPCATDSDAKYLRLELYRAIKKYRDDPFLDEGLTEAAELCTVGQKKGSKNVLVISRKAPMDNVLNVARSLGIDPDNILAAPDSLEQAEALVSQERMLKKLGMEPTTKPDVDTSMVPCLTCKGTGKHVLPDDTVINCPECSPKGPRTTRFYTR